MRKDVKKFLFIGPEAEKEHFFKHAQTFGLVHFIEPKKTSSGMVQPLPEELQNVTKAIRVLRGLLLVEQEEMTDHLDANAVVASILQAEAHRQKLEEEMRLLDLEIARISPFGPFSADDVSYIEKYGKHVIQFFVAKPGLFQESSLPDEMIRIGEEEGLDYFVSIQKEKRLYPKMVEIQIPQPLVELKKRRQAADKEHRLFETELKTYAKYNHFLHGALLEKLNQYHLDLAQKSVQEALNGALFTVEGWVPVTRIEEVGQCVAGLKIYAEEVAIEPTDSVPTYLENRGAARLGEDLVRIYDTPSATDKDPSIWVLSGFALFFAFIIGDAGYGLVYLALALFLRYRFPDLRGVAKRVLNLFTLLCVACIVWGTLMTSFFGMQISPENPLRKVSLLQWLAKKKAFYHMSHRDAVYEELIEKYPSLANAKDVDAFLSYTQVLGTKDKAVVLDKLSDHIMFELALFIGIIHLILSLLRYAKRNPPNIGWALFLVGAYLYFAYYLDTPTLLNFVGGVDLVKGGKVGLEIMIFGISFAWLSSIYIHGWKGIFEVMTLIQVFADSLSYLRLYALGLAGAIVASTVNEIAAGLPFLLGGLLIVVAHFINIALSTMSGVIHGLRLNFLEWYHYSFEGGGKQFKPLEQLKQEK